MQILATLAYLEEHAGERHPSSREALITDRRGDLMKKSSSFMKLVAFDAARYLDSDEAVAEYMSAMLEANDPDLLLLALGDVARAKGMAQVAKEAGLGRESLYKALTPGAKPRFDTILKVARALGVKFTAQAV
jgi:probable addiction module antidote protein